MADFFKPRDRATYVRSGKREVLTVSNAVKQLTSATYAIQQAAAANKSHISDILPIGAVIQVLGQPIRFTLDGTDPAAAVGFSTVAKDLIYLNSYQEVKAFKAIREGASDATIEVLYLYGR
jgi:hypothetical protein